MSRSAAVLILVSLPAAASSFGHAGQVMPAGGFSVSYATAGDATAVDLSVQPELAYFVREHLAIGGGVQYIASKLTTNGVDQPTTTTAGLYAFAAWDFPLGDWASIFPSIEGYLVQRNSGAAGAIPTRAGASVFVPILFHPAPHCFLGAGPALAQDLYSSVTDAPHAFQVRLRSIIGIYF